jgi:hypothetical protein
VAVALTRKDDPPLDVNRTAMTSPVRTGELVSMAKPPGLMSQILIGAPDATS